MTSDRLPDQDESDEKATIKYTQAMAELSQILAEIESDGVDLDELAVKVARAAELIQICRQKIRSTEMQVKAIIDDLDDETKT